jgi:hypothetical protein
MINDWKKKEDLEADNATLSELLQITPNTKIQEGIKTQASWTLDVRHFA